MRTSRFMMAIAVSLGIAAAAYVVRREVAIDRCLDHGGGWEHGKCVGAE